MAHARRSDDDAKETAQQEMHIIDEFLKAVDRIEKDYGGKDAWLLHFMQADLKALSQGDCTNLRYEFLVWVGTSWTDGRPLAAEHEPDLHPAVELLLPLQGVARSYVKRFVDEEQVVFPEIRMKPWIWRHKPDEMEQYPSGKKRLSPTAGQITHDEVIQGKLNTFRFACYRSLCGLGERLKQCPECQRYFVADQRSDRTYCSPGCQGRAGTKRYRRRLKSHPQKGHARRKGRKSM